MNKNSILTNETNDKIPPKQGVEENKQNISIVVPDKMFSEESLKVMTSEQLIDTLSRQGSSVAKIIEAKIKEEKNIIPVISQDNIVSNNANNIKEEKTVMDEKLTASIEGLNTKFDQLLTAFAALTPKPPEVPAAVTAPVASAPPIPAPAEIPPAPVDDPMKALMDEITVMKAQNAALAAQVKVITDQPLVANVSTGVAPTLPETLTIPSAQQAGSSDKATEIAAIEAKMLTMGNTQEKIELGKKLNALVMGI